MLLKVEGNPGESLGHGESENTTADTDDTDDGVTNSAEDNADTSPESSDITDPMASQGPAIGTGAAQNETGRPQANNGTTLI